MALTFTRRTGATVRVDGAGTDENLPSVAAYGQTAEWTASGHVLGVGELGLDTTTGEMRAGNGSSVWASLSNVLSGTYGRITAEAVPRSRRLCMVGDSITDAGNPGGNNTNLRINGLQVFDSSSIVGAALAQSDGRLRVGGVAATGNFTAAQIRATHVPTIIANATPGDVVVVLAGTNDAPAGSVSSTTATLAGIYSDLAAAGLVPVPCTLPPNGNPAQYVSFIQTVNAWIQRTADALGYSVADFYQVLVDTSNNRYQAAYTSDNVHPTVAGAWVAGTELVRAVHARVPAVPPSGLFCTNAYPSGLLGTTNAVLLTDSNADGIPNGWSLLAAAGTSTFALTTDAAYVGQKLTMTRGDTDALLQSGNFTLTPGHRILFGARFKATVAASGSWSIRMENVGGSGPLVGYSNVTAGNGTVGTVVWDFVVPTGWPTYVFRVDLYCQTGAATALEIGQITVRNLTAEGID